jgi:hypothetical protein
VNELLTKLTRIQSGQNLSSVVTAERINAIQDAIKAIAQGANINAGAGTRLTKSVGGVTISANDLPDRRDRQTNMFSYYADGTNEVVSSIGQDPSARSISYNKLQAPISGELTYLDGGVHKLRGLSSVGGQAPSLPYPNPNGNPGGRTDKGKFRGKLSALNLTPYLLDYNIQGSHIARLVVLKDDESGAELGLKRDNEWTNSNRTLEAHDPVNEKKIEYLEFLKDGIYQLSFDATAFLALDDCDPRMNYHNRTHAFYATVGGKRDDGDEDTPESIVTPSLFYTTINTSKRVPSDLQANLNFHFTDPWHKDKTYCIDHDVVIRPSTCSTYKQNGKGPSSGGWCDGPVRIPTPCCPVSQPDMQGYVYGTQVDGIPSTCLYPQLSPCEDPKQVPEGYEIEEKEIEVFGECGTKSITAWECDVTTITIPTLRSTKVKIPEFEIKKHKLLEGVEYAKVLTTPVPVEVLTSKYRKLSVWTGSEYVTTLTEPTLVVTPSELESVYVSSDWKAVKIPQEYEPNLIPRSFTKVNVLTDFKVKTVLTKTEQVSIVTKPKRVDHILSGVTKIKVAEKVPCESVEGATKWDNEKHYEDGGIVTHGGQYYKVAADRLLEPGDEPGGEQWTIISRPCIKIRIPTEQEDYQFYYNPETRGVIECPYDNYGEPIKTPVPKWVDTQSIPQKGKDTSIPNFKSNPQTVAKYAGACNGHLVTGLADVFVPDLEYKTIKLAEIDDTKNIDLRCLKITNTLSLTSGRFPQFTASVTNGVFPTCYINGSWPVWSSGSVSPGTAASFSAGSLPSLDITDNFAISNTLEFTISLTEGTWPSGSGTVTLEDGTWPTGSGTVTLSEGEWPTISCTGAYWNAGSPPSFDFDCTISGDITTTGESWSPGSLGVEGIPCVFASGTLPTYIPGELPTLTGGAWPSGGTFPTGSGTVTLSGATATHNLSITGCFPPVVVLPTIDCTPGQAGSSGSDGTGGGGGAAGTNGVAGGDGGDGGDGGSGYVDPCNPPTPCSEPDTEKYPENDGCPPGCVETEGVCWTDDGNYTEVCGANGNAGGDGGDGGSGGAGGGAGTGGAGGAGGTGGAGGAGGDGGYCTVTAGSVTPGSCGEVTGSITISLSAAAATFTLSGGSWPSGGSWRTFDAGEAAIHQPGTYPTCTPGRVTTLGTLPELTFPTWDASGLSFDCTGSFDAGTLPSLTFPTCTIIPGTWPTGSGTFTLDDGTWPTGSGVFTLGGGEWPTGTISSSSGSIGLTGAISTSWHRGSLPVLVPGTATSVVLPTLVGTWPDIKCAGGTWPTVTITEKAGTSALWPTITGTISVDTSHCDEHIIQGVKAREEKIPVLKSPTTHTTRGVTGLSNCTALRDGGSVVVGGVDRLPDILIQTWEDGISFERFEKGHEYILGKECVNAHFFKDYVDVTIPVEIKEVELPYLESTEIYVPEKVLKGGYIGTETKTIHYPTHSVNLGTATKSKNISIIEYQKNVYTVKNLTTIRVPIATQQITVIKKVQTVYAAENYKTLTIPLEQVDLQIPTEKVRISVPSAEATIVMPKKEVEVEIPVIKKHVEINIPEVVKITNVNVLSNPTSGKLEVLTPGEKYTILVQTIKKVEPPTEYVIAEKCEKCSPCCGEPYGQLDGKNCEDDENQPPGAWVDSGSRTFFLEVTKRSALENSNTGKDPYTEEGWDAREDKKGKPKERGSYNSHKLDDKPHHDFVIRFMDIGYIWSKDKYGRDYRAPRNSVHRYSSNQLRVYGHTAHWEIESGEHPADDCRWVDKASQVASMGLNITRLGPIENIDAVNRPAALPSDMSERQKKRKHTDAEQAGEWVYGNVRHKVSHPDDLDGIGNTIG